MTSPSQEEPLVIDGFKVHAKSDCVPPCPFHAPSDHPLKDAPMHIREDKSYLVERICPHGIGHDDPDSVAYMHKIGESWAGTHGCDGCCTGDYPIKPVPNEPSDERAYVDKCTCGHFRGDHTPMMDDDSDSCWGCNCKKFNPEPSDDIKTGKPIETSFDRTRKEVQSHEPSDSPKPSVDSSPLIDQKSTEVGNVDQVSAIGDELNAPTLDEVVEFLCGASDLRGKWFGEIPEGVVGAFWWRRILREAVEADREEQTKLARLEERKQVKMYNELTRIGREENDNRIADLEASIKERSEDERS